MENVPTKSSKICYRRYGGSKQEMTRRNTLAPMSAKKLLRRCRTHDLVFATLAFAVALTCVWTLDTTKRPNDWAKAWAGPATPSMSKVVTETGSGTRLEDTAAANNNIAVDVTGEACDGQAVKFATRDPLARKIAGIDPTSPWNPASAMKLLTLSAALKVLEPDFKFKYTLSGKQVDDRIASDLLVNTQGSPVFSPSDLSALIAQLKARGVTSIRGPIVLESSHFNDVHDPPGFSEFESDHPYRSGIGSVQMMRNVVEIQIESGRKTRRRYNKPTVTIHPPNDYVKVVNTMQVKGRRSRMTISTKEEGSRTVINVGGSIIPRSGKRYFWKRVFHPEAYFVSALTTALANEGIRISRPGYKIKRMTGSDLAVLASGYSPLLSELVRSAAKHSSNIIAESLYLAIGQRRFGGSANWDKAKRALYEFLANYGINKNDVTIVNGSGLAREARVNSGALSKLLAKLYYDPDIGPSLISSLPIFGIDGTLKKAIFKGSPLVGRIRAKTGTLDGISTLAGFLHTCETQYSFAISVESSQPGYQRKACQRAVLEALDGALTEKCQSEN